MRFTLPKSKRLKGQKNIETLFRQGEAFFVHPYRVVHIQNDSIASTTMGFAVSKKLFRHAVGRNKIKRLTREVYRLQQHDLQMLKPRHIMFQYAAKEVLAYDRLQKSMAKIILTLNQLDQENG